MQRKKEHELLDIYWTYILLNKLHFPQNKGIVDQRSFHFFSLFLLPSLPSKIENIKSKKEV